ncbi:MAG: DUF898 domain-containing protein [Immundisolibacteraceae bacterium]|nr:DUF898 domain-containing protein [Immundisolibacteraceae bacterium]
MAASAETIIPASPGSSASEPKILAFEFHGSGVEFFKIWIVNLALTILSLGIFSAWAKVRTQRYLYGNTRLDGHAFTYLADPVKILKGRFIAFGFLLVYSLAWNFYPDAGMLLLVIGVLLLPAILVAATRFKMRNSSYRNLRFGFNTRFTTAYRMFASPMMIVLLLTGLGYGLLQFVDLDTLMTSLQPVDDEVEQPVSISAAQLIPSIFYLVLLPFIPYLDYLRSHFVIDNSHYGNAPARLKSSVGSFYETYLMSLLVFIVAISIGIALLMGIFGLISLLDTETNSNLIGVVAAIAGVVSMYAMMFFAAGYFHARRTNLIYGNGFFGDAQLISKLKFMPVSWIFLSNTVAIILSLGLLIPWARIRMARYVAGVTHLQSSNFALITAVENAGQGALGEGVVDAFDLDIGL